MKAVRHFGIVVQDMEKSLHFYENLLRLKNGVHSIEQGKFIDQLLQVPNVRVQIVKMVSDSGETKIELLKYKDGVEETHIAFTVEDVDKEYKRLKEQGVQFTCEPQVSPDGKAKVTFCFDPDDTPIELVQEL